MNVEEILNNGSTYYNLPQEFNFSDSLTNLIKEELEVHSNSSELFNVNFYDKLDDGKLPPRKNPKDDKPNPRKIGYCKKRRSNNVDRRNNKKKKIVVSNADYSDRSKDLIELINDLENDDISLPLILENNYKSTSNNVGKNVNNYYDNVQNGNVLSKSINHQTGDKLNIITSKLNNNVDSQTFVGDAQDGNIIPVSQEDNLKAVTVDNSNNSEEEIVIEEEIILNDSMDGVDNDNDAGQEMITRSDLQNQNILPLNNSSVISNDTHIIDSKSICENKETSISLEHNEPMVVDDPGGSDQEFIIEEEITMYDDDEPLIIVPEEEISKTADCHQSLDQGAVIEEKSGKYHKILVDNSTDLNQKTDDVKGFTADNNKLMINSKEDKLVPVSIVSEKNTETVVDFDQEIVIEEEEFIVDDENSVGDLKEDAVPTPVVEEDNKTTVNRNNLEEFVVEEQEFVINEPSEEENEKDTALMTPKENNETNTIDKNNISDEEIVLEEEITINDSNEEVDNENDNLIPAVDNNCSTKEEIINKPDVALNENTDCLEMEENLKECIDEIFNDSMFAIPTTPIKSTFSSPEKFNSLSVSPFKGFDKNLLTPLNLEGLNSDEEYDKLCIEKLEAIQDPKQRSICTDSEIERVCESIKNDSMEPAAFDFEAIEMLNNFNGIDQTTNDKLLADLLGSPETNSSRKNQDYMITVDPLIDHSTSIPSVSDSSNDDLGIEVKSRHIKQMIKKNAERKKFFKLQKSRLQSNASTGENEDEFDKRKKRTRNINYNEDTDDSIGDVLRNTGKTTKPKRRRTKSVFSKIEGRRKSRFTKKSTNKENSQDNEDNCVNNVNVKNICKKLPIIRLRRVNSSKPEDSSNQENGYISGRNPEDDLWIMNFDGSLVEEDLLANDQDPLENDKKIIENSKSPSENEKTSGLNDMETESGIKQFFTDDKIQNNYDKLTDMSLSNTNDLLDKSITNEELIKESLPEKLDENDKENKEEEEEINSVPSPSKEDQSVEIGEQPSIEPQENNEDQPAEETTESRLKETSLVGRKIEMSENFEENLNDDQSDVDENIVSSSTEKGKTNKSLSKEQVDGNSKSQDVPTSSNDNKLTECESERSDIADGNDSDLADSFTVDTSIHPQKLESGNVAETDGIRERTIQKLLFLKVKLEHMVPIQQTIETNVGLFIEPDDREEFIRYAKLDSGRFKRRDQLIIQRNWKRFCEVHELDPSCIDLMFEKCHDKRRSVVVAMKDKCKFLQFLARDLPNRMLCQVFIHFRNFWLGKIPRKLKKKKRTGLFLLREDRLIMEYLDHRDDSSDKDTEKKDNEKVLEELSEKLNRSKSSIIERFDLLKKRRLGVPMIRKRQIDWNVTLTEKFIKEFMDVTLTEDIMELKYAIIPLSIWYELERRLNIPNANLKTFWFCHLHIQLFCPNRIYKNDLRIMIIEYLYVKGISDRNEIEWDDFVKHFDDGITKELILQYYSVLIKRAQDENKEMNFLECIEWLYEVRIPTIVKMKCDSYLPRLAYKDGKLENIDDGDESSTSESD